MLGGKNDKKGGKCVFFPIGKKYAYFFPKLLSLQNYYKKGAHLLNLINFIWGKI